MKKFLLALTIVFSFITARAQAQYVTVPDLNFAAYLQTAFPACMNGNQLDTTCSNVTAALNLNVSDKNIADLTGVQYFDNLQILNCSENDLTWLPDLPFTLTQLLCGTNDLASLPELPAQLTILKCAVNDLTSFPTLPAGLKNLECSGNPLSALPSPLPSTLEILSCGGLSLVSLPPFPNTLQELVVYNTPMTALPALPNSLVKLRVDFNQLASLPALPFGLTYLSCKYNEITSLPTLPGSLEDLVVTSNLLTSLPALPNNLDFLQCDNNGIEALPVLPASLTRLVCNYNNLTSLPILPNGLTRLSCSHNQLSYLEPFPPNLNDLSIHNNLNLACLPPVLNLMISNLSFYGTSITCLPNHIQHFGSWDIDTLPLCAPINPNNCPTSWNIAAQVYNDTNSDCFSNAEAGLRNIKLSLRNDGVLQEQVMSNGAGFYSFQTAVDTYTVSIDTTGLPLLVTCPVSNLTSSIITAASPLDTAANFALECKPGYDLVVTHIGPATLFPGNIESVSVYATDLAEFFGINCNTQGLSGLVTINVSGPVTVSSAVNGGIVTGNAVNWTINDFSTVSSDHFSIQLLANTTATGGEQVCIDATIIAATGTDNNLLNNQLVHCFTVVNSFDPNYKEVYPTTPSPDTWYTYTVHFQNTGTAAAQHILVKDTLDSSFDWTSFQRLSSSHDDLTQVKENGIVHFNFPNINLPDSTSNEPESHGWIQYKIKSKSTVDPATTTIHNTASIYFDFNDPIKTNDALVEPATGIRSLSTFDFSLSPNPASDMVSLTLERATSNALVVITDVTGRVITKQTINGQQAQLQLEDLVAGTYLVRLSHGNKTAGVKKLVVIR